ncbi:unnamed protein product [Nesidiocoris tenuis]|uniref:CCHC-type domain-containing protein n=1 Tax=Nesidiocoris tenuis TaxID=355587 RepID=A0A6H5FYC6_9HEMI|nr:unnamed protein product [Nesidiocoris tenuis]
MCQEALDEAVHSLDKELKTMPHELNKFLTNQKNKMPAGMYEFLNEWNRRAAATTGRARTTLWQLQGKCLGLATMNRETMLAVVREAVQAVRPEPSLSPVMRSVRTIEKGVSGLVEGLSERGDGGPHGNVIQAVSGIGKKIDRQQQMISNHVKTLKESIAEMGQVLPATTSDDDADWTYAGRARRDRRKVRKPPAESEGKAKPMVQKETSAMHVSQVRAELRNRLATQGGPIPTARTRTLIVKAESGDTSKKLAEIGRPAELGIDVWEVRPGRANELIMEVPCQTDIRPLADSSARVGLTVREAPSKRPRILVHGVPADFSREQICEEFMLANAMSLDPAVKKDGFLPVYMVGPRDAPTRKWVIEVSPVVRLELLKESRLRIGWYACKLGDHISVTRCYRCQAFGHVAAVCLRDPVCGFCAAKGHTFRECKREGTPKCANCSVTAEDPNHEAGDLRCPSTRRAMETQIKRTDYGKNDQQHCPLFC